ncbi:MAG TPA: HAD family hydrolase [Actinomycetales bacterium]
MRADVDAVLLDVDDTVVDTRGGFAVGMAVVARAYLSHLGDDGPGLALEQWVRDAGGYFAAFTRGELGFAEQRRLRVTAMHQALGGPVVDDGLFEEWDTAYDRAFRAAWRPLPGAGRLLDLLTAAGVPFGSVTNSVTSYQQDKLDSTGLGRLRVLVGTDTLGLGKPDPRVFLHACELLGSDPARTVYVGDEPHVDAQAAQDAGLMGVWVDRWAEGLQPDRSRGGPPWTGPTVRSMDQLVQWLGLDPAADLGPRSAAR